MEVATIDSTSVADAEVSGHANADEDNLRAEIMQAFKTLNAAFERCDTATIEALTTKDHVSVTSFYAGAIPWSEQREIINDLDIVQHPVGDVVISSLSPDVVLQNHIAQRKGTMRGVPIPTLAAVTIVWQRVDGEWRERQYQETAIERAN